MIAVIAILLGLLSGCGTIARSEFPLRECWSYPEQLTERTRSLPGVTGHQALGAAEDLLRLTWGTDAKIVRTPRTLSAEIRRDRWFYLLLVAYRGVVDEAWTITARPEAEGAGVCVQIHGRYFTDAFVLGAEPITNVVYPASASERSRGLFMPPARALSIDFDTFWGRLEYLVGLRSDWVACSSSGPHRNAARNRVEFDPLCHHLVADPMPPPPSGSR